MQDINQENIRFNVNMDYNSPNSPAQEPTISLEHSPPCTPIPTSSYYAAPLLLDDQNGQDIELESHSPSLFTQIQNLETESCDDGNEPSCAVCQQSCSRAHHCPGCDLPVHAICGQPVAGLEGFGSPVWCVSCFLKEREGSHNQGRTSAKRRQEKQIQRMERQTLKKAKQLDIGDNILVHVPEVDKRSPFDPPNISGVITEQNEEGYLKIGTSAGTLDRSYLPSEVEFSFSHFLSLEDVPNVIVTLRKAVLASSLGKSRLFCHCNSGCGSNRCRCMRLGKICNSKCHKKLACHNK